MPFALKGLHAIRNPRFVLNRNLEITMKTLGALSFLVALCACTANVENPTLNQQGRGGNTTCVMDCDSTNTTCVAKCTDDACKAACSTQHDECTSSCAPTDAGAGD
jgi:hypothetical protein